MWFLRWIPYAIEHLVDPFVTDQINAPAGVNLMWNASITALSLAFAPVTLIGGPILAYNVAIVASVALSAWCAYLLLMRLTTSPAASMVGGAVYGFSPYVASHMVLHLNLTSVWIPPLFVLLLHELVVARQRSPRVLGASVGLLAACQLLISEEVLATSAVAASLLVVVLLVIGLHRRAGAPRTVPTRRRGHLPAGGLCGRRPRGRWPSSSSAATDRQPGPERRDVLHRSAERGDPDPIPAVLTRSGHRRVRQIQRPVPRGDRVCGLPLLVLLVVSVVINWRDVRMRIAGGMALILLVASFGPVLQVNAESAGIPMPWALISHAPLIEHALPGRLTVYMWLAIAVIVTITVEALRRLPGQRAVPAFLVMAAAVALAAPAPMRWWSTEVPAFFERWDDHGIRDDAIVLMAPYFTNGAGADPMLWAAVAGNQPRMYEAYAYVPDGTNSLRSANDNAGPASWRPSRTVASSSSRATPPGTKSRPSSPTPGSPMSSSDRCGIEGRWSRSSPTCSDAPGRGRRRRVVARRPRGRRRAGASGLIRQHGAQRDRMRRRIPVRGFRFSLAAGGGSACLLEAPR